jgi:hypothetical protein
MNKGRYLSTVSKACLTLLNLVIFGIGCFMVRFYIRLSYSPQILTSVFSVEPAFTFLVGRLVRLLHTVAGHAL